MASPARTTERSRQENAKASSFTEAGDSTSGARRVLYPISKSRIPQFRAGCQISSPAGVRERGRPAGRGAVSRDTCCSGEHPVGLFADRIRAG